MSPSPTRNIYGNQMLLVLMICVLKQVRPLQLVWLNNKSQGQLLVTVSNAMIFILIKLCETFLNLIQCILQRILNLYEDQGFMLFNSLFC